MKITTATNVIFATNKDAPKYRLISVDLENPAKRNWKTLVKAHQKSVLEWANRVGDDILVIGYVIDAKVFNLVWKINQIGMFWKCEKKSFAE